jgi:hypothetical protein
MSLIRFMTDEDVYGHVAVQLRAVGFDAVSTPEAGRLGASDPDQLSWAAQQGRALITFNVGDFARLHYEWMSQDLHHAGLILSQQRSLGDVLRRLLNLSQDLSQEDMQDRLEYLSNWPSS